MKKMIATKGVQLVKRIERKVEPNLDLESKYLEIVQEIHSSFVLQSDSSSLAQPLPTKVLPTVVTYGAYEQPIVG